MFQNLRATGPKPDKNTCHQTVIATKTARVLLELLAIEKGSYADAPTDVCPGGSNSSYLLPLTGQSN